MKKNICATLSFLMLASCMTQPAAPIEYGSSENRRSGYSEHTKRGLSDEEGGIKSRQLEGKKTATPAGEMREKDEPFTEYKEVNESSQEEKPMTRQEMVKEENKLENDLTKEDKKLKSLEEEMDEMESQQVAEKPVAQKVSEDEEVVRPDKVKDEGAADGGDNLKFFMPVSGKIITKFGDDIGGKKSNGINISAARGSGVKSIAEGRVVFAGADPKFGNLMIIKVGATDMFAAYAYMDDLMLQKDDDVTKGQVIGHVGATGDASVPQLHFALRKGKTPVDPMGYLTTGR